VRRSRSLNLASKGFTNERPLRRAAVLLALVGLVLLGVNAILYGRYQAASVEVRSQLREVESGIEKELGAVQVLEASLSRLDLEAQNEQVEFLNDRIAERTFPWSQLFDHLTEVLPAEVRLSSLSPTSESRDRSRRRLDDSSVRLAMSGEAKTDEALVAFVDGLFSSPSFTDPHLTQENRETGAVRFVLDARYLPRAPGAPPTSATEVAEAAPGAMSAEQGPSSPAGAAAPAASSETLSTSAHGTSEPSPPTSTTPGEPVAGAPSSPGEIAAAARESSVPPSGVAPPEPVAQRGEEIDVGGDARSTAGDARELSRRSRETTSGGGAVAVPRSSTGARPPAAPGGATGTVPERRPRTGREGVPAVQPPSNASAPPRLRGGV